MPGERSRRVATFEATCADCGRSFAAPSLGDFAWGQFLFFGERGTVFAHLDGIDHPVWRFVESFVGSDGDTVRRALASIADPIDGQRLSSVRVCPHCRSTNWRSWEGENVGDVDVPEVSFERFNRLSESERVNAFRSTTAGHDGFAQFGEGNVPAGDAVGNEGQMLVVPELKGWDCPDIADLEKWSPADDETIFWMTLSIGLPGSPAADNFEVCVAAPAGLRSALGRETRSRGRDAPPPIVLQTYSWPALWEEIQSRLRASAGTDWLDVQEKLRRRFAWEYEGYK